MIVIVNDNVILRKWLNVPGLYDNIIQKKIFKKEKKAQNN